MQILIHPDFQFNIYGINFSNLLHADSYTETSSIFRAHYPSGYDEFTGNNFTYNINGTPISGTVTGYSAHSGSQISMSISEIAIAVSAFVNAAMTVTLEDDATVLVYALSGADTFVGGDSNDVVGTFGGNDGIAGGRGNDMMDGGSGDDLLWGGAGADDLWGASGRDDFWYARASDSTVRQRDTIHDFSSSDRIDLADIDANTRQSGNQRFDFIGKHGFTGDAGELRVTVKNGNALVEADLNGDRKVDVAILVEDHGAMSAGDFLL